MVKTVSESKTVHDLVWEALTRGVTNKLENENIKIDKWSPNNLRRIIISPDGVVFQPFITAGTFFKSPIGLVNFPVSEKTAKELSGKTTISSVLYRNRVFSSIEEIIIIPHSSQSPNTLHAKEVGVLLHSKVNSFKRLANIIIIQDKISLKDFVARNIVAMRDKYSTLATSNEANLGNNRVIEVVKDWYNHTSLRPQYYTLDEDGKNLSKYFKDVKEKLSNLDKKSIVRGTPKNSDEKEPKSVETEKKPISEFAKRVLTYRLKQVTISQNRNLPDNKLFVINDNRVSDVRQVKSGSGFDFDGDGNSMLKYLGLYEDGGSSDSSKLVDVVSKQIVSTVKRFIADLKETDSLLGTALDRRLKPIINKVGLNSDSVNKEALKKLASLTYRDSFNESLLVPVSDDTNPKSLLLGGLSDLTTDTVQSLVKGILFDLNYPQDYIEVEYSDGKLTDLKSEVTGLDMLVLHDLYIYANKVNHRMYNSLFTSNREGNKGYVTDQPVIERIRLLVKESKLSGSGVNEYDKCLTLVDDLLIEDYKHMFRGYRPNIKSSLDRLLKLDKSDEEERKQTVANTIITLLNEMISRKDYKLALSYSLSKQNNYKKLGGQGGTKNWDILVNKMIDYDKPLNSDYSSYLELLKSLVLKG